MIKDITDVDEKYVSSLIEQIMNDIASGNLLYANEREFQCDLLERIKCDIKNQDIIARVEQFSQVNKNGNKERVDVLIYDKNNNYVVIELKYKKKAAVYKVNSSMEILWDDGAHDEGLYDYFWDIHRLETLKKHNNNNSKNTISHHCVTFKAGYAIMITNDKSYWDTKTFNDIGDKMREQLNDIDGTIKKIEWGYKEGPIKKKEPSFIKKGRFKNSGIDLNDGKGYDCTRNKTSTDKTCYYLNVDEIKRMKNQGDYENLLDTKKTPLKDKLEFHSYITIVEK